MNPSILPRLACLAAFGLLAPIGCQAQDNTPPATAAASLPDFTGIVAQNAPAVVHVEAKYSGDRQQGNAAMSDPQAEMLRRFFGMPMMPSPAERRHTSLGSGFIISSDGYILTNNHVVEDADKVTVRLQDRRTLTAKVVGTDPTYDIALLKVDAGDKLPTVKIGNSRTLKAGQWVLAIGSPFGFDYTVTQGIVSAVGRNLGQRDQPYTAFIQTDVPINRGNSGGPLFNLQGQVVGINSQIYSHTGDYMGVSFSIPIDVAMNAVDQLKSKGYVSRGQLGVRIQPVGADMVKAFGLEDGTGAAVVDVTPDSGAAKAGIQPGDIIEKFNHQTVHQASDLPPMVGMTKPGSKVPVEVLRDGKSRTFDVRIGEAARDRDAVDNVTASSGSSHGAAALGLSVQSIDKDTRDELGLKSGQGVVISDVTGPVAAEAGLRPGDVIMMVNQQKIGSVSEFKAATAKAEAGSTVLLLVRRGDQSRFIGLTVPSAR